MRLRRLLGLLERRLLGLAMSAVLLLFERRLRRARRRRPVQPA